MYHNWGQGMAYITGSSIGTGLITFLIYRKWHTGISDYNIIFSCEVQYDSYVCTYLQMVPKSNVTVKDKFTNVHMHIPNQTNWKFRFLSCLSIKRGPILPTIAQYNFIRKSHCGLVNSLRPHICVGKLTIIGPDNGLSPGRRQAIIWTNAGILLIGPLGTNFSEMII